MMSYKMFSHKKFILLMRNYY